MSAPRKKLKIIAVDCEYDMRCRPFICTMTTDTMKSRLFNLRKGDNGHYERVKKIAESSNVIKVFHSATSDIYALSTIGINVIPPYECTLIAASLLDENFASRKLKVMAKLYLDEECLEDKELTKIKTKLKKQAKKDGLEFDYTMIPDEILEPYATKDTEYTMGLWKQFKEPIKAYQQLYDFEKSLIPIIVGMTQRGMRVDRKFVKKLMLVTARRSELLYKKLNRHITKKFSDIEVFNPGSPKQVANVLDRLDLGLTETTKKGNLKTDIKTLMPHIKIPFINALLSYRFFSKQNSTYYSPLYKKYTTKKDHIAHFAFYQSGAKTGRFSAELIQVMPKLTEDKVLKVTKEVRKSFIPRDGYTMYFIDYDQIEMRLFIHFSRCHAVAKQVRAGFDTHTGTLNMVMGKKFVDKLNTKDFASYRYMMKGINFGMVYGMGMNKLIEQLLICGISMRRYEAELLMKKYLSIYPVKKFMKDLMFELYKTGCITLKFKSKLMNFTREYRVPKRLAYKAANVVCQGAAAYVMKYGMVRSIKLIARKKWDANLLATVHDELVFELSNKLNHKKIVPQIVRAMEDRVTFMLPITASVSYTTKNWGEKKEWVK